MEDSNIPKWKVSGDWFDVCKCSIPCPCEFAQTPTYGDCDGVLAYHIKNGDYGKMSLDGLNALALADFKGNIWAGNTKANIAIFFDEKANDEQRDALNMIFTGKAGYIIILTVNSARHEEVNGISRFHHTGVFVYGKDLNASHSRCMLTSPIPINGVDNHCFHSPFHINSMIYYLQI